MTRILFLSLTAALACQFGEHCGASAPASCELNHAGFGEIPICMQHANPQQNYTKLLLSEVRSEALFARGRNSPTNLDGHGQLECPNEARLTVRALFVRAFVNSFLCRGGGFVSAIGTETGIKDLLCFLLGYALLGDTEAVVTGELLIDEFGSRFTGNAGVQLVNGKAAGTIVMASGDSVHHSVVLAIQAVKTVAANGMKDLLVVNVGLKLGIRYSRGDSVYEHEVAKSTEITLSH